MVCDGRSKRRKCRGGYTWVGWKEGERDSLLIRTRHSLVYSRSRLYRQCTESTYTNVGTEMCPRYDGWWMIAACIDKQSLGNPVMVVGSNSIRWNDANGPCKPAFRGQSYSTFFVTSSRKQSFLITLISEWKVHDIWNFKLCNSQYHNYN